ncbi:hypothetical protein C8Q75DRAFT_806116 [Abortiporus biennis]|nr:hypothetical protein C8Q75DRAFT_806116 [Abortiporus biennis]
MATTSAVHLILRNAPEPLIQLFFHIHPSPFAWVSYITATFLLLQSFMSTHHIQTGWNRDLVADADNLDSNNLTSAPINTETQESLYLEMIAIRTLFSLRHGRCHIKRLPQELLCEIFLRYAESCWQQSLSNSGEVSISRCYEYIRITEVCKLWRSVALNNGRLWNFIKIPQVSLSVKDSTTSSGPAPFVFPIKDLLERSRTAPLTVVGEICAPKDASMQEVVWNISHRFTQIGVIDLKLPMLGIRKFMKVMFVDSVRSSARNRQPNVLRELSLTLNSVIRGPQTELSKTYPDEKVLRFYSVFKGLDPTSESSQEGQSKLTFPQLRKIAFTDFCLTFSRTFISPHITSFIYKTTGKSHLPPPPVNNLLKVISQMRSLETLSLCLKFNNHERDISMVQSQVTHSITGGSKDDAFSKVANTIIPLRKLKILSLSALYTIILKILNKIELSSTVKIGIDILQYHPRLMPPMEQYSANTRQAMNNKLASILWKWSQRRIAAAPATSTQDEGVNVDSSEEELTFLNISRTHDVYPIGDTCHTYLQAWDSSFSPTSTEISKDIFQGWSLTNSMISYDAKPILSIGFPIQTFADSTTEMTDLLEALVITAPIFQSIRTIQFKESDSKRPCIRGLWPFSEPLFGRMPPVGPEEDVRSKRGWKARNDIPTHILPLFSNSLKNLVIDGIGCSEENICDDAIWETLYRRRYLKNPDGTQVAIEGGLGLNLDKVLVHGISFNGSDKLSKFMQYCCISGRGPLAFDRLNGIMSLRMEAKQILLASLEKITSEIGEVEDWELCDCFFTGYKEKKFEFENIEELVFVL